MKQAFNDSLTNYIPIYHTAYCKIPLTDEVRHKTVENVFSVCLHSTQSTFSKLNSLATAMINKAMSKTTSLMIYLLSFMFKLKSVIQQSLLSFL